MNFMRISDIFLFSKYQFFFESQKICGNLALTLTTITSSQANPRVFQNVDSIKIFTTEIDSWKIGKQDINFSTCILLLWMIYLTQHISIFNSRSNAKKMFQRMFISKQIFKKYYSNFTVPTKNGFSTGCGSQVAPPYWVRNADHIIKNCIE